MLFGTGGTESTALARRGQPWGLLSVRHHAPLLWQHHQRNIPSIQRISLSSYFSAP